MISSENFDDLNKLRDELHATAVDHGWWEPQYQTVALPLLGGPTKALVQRTFGDLMSLVHSEASEALEEHRNGHQETETYFSESGKPEGIPIELADVIIRVLDICGYYRIDIAEAMLVKARYNETRPYRHGEKAL